MKAFKKYPSLYEIPANELSSPIIFPIKSEGEVSDDILNFINFLVFNNKHAISAEKVFAVPEGPSKRTGTPIDI